MRFPLWLEAPRLSSLVIPRHGILLPGPGRTQVPGSGGWIFNHRTTREVLLAPLADEEAHSEGLPV